MLQKHLSGQLESICKQTVGIWLMNLWSREQLVAPSSNGDVSPKQYFSFTDIDPSWTVVNIHSAEVLCVTVLRNFKGIFFSPLKFTDSTQRFMEFKLRSPYPGPTHILKPNSNMLCQSPFSSHTVEINLPPLSPHGNIVPPTKIHVFFF